MLRLEHVCFGYERQKTIINDLCLDIPEGSRLCLMGPSGEGKTTLLRLLLGLEKPRKGKILRREGLRCSTVFQEDRLLPWLTVAENAALFSDGETARQLLEELGLADSMEQRPEELSGGMKRRVALARALACPFDLLVLDEALTGLDGENRTRCLALIDRVLGRRTLVLATHNREEAEALGAKIMKLEKDNIVEATKDF